MRNPAPRWIIFFALGLLAACTAPTTPPPAPAPVATTPKPAPDLDALLATMTLEQKIAQLMVIDCLFIRVAQMDYDASMEAIRSTYATIQRLTTRR